MAYLLINKGSSSLKISLFNKNLERIQECRSLEEVDVVPEWIGHRIVHGGDFATPQRITPEVEKKLQALSELAPLHNPASLESLDLARRRFPEIAQYACFDTSFHRTLPPVAALYPIPLELSKKHRIKRYGFHGISHAYLSRTYYATHPLKDKVIAMHLGSGCSLAALHEGKSVDTTMGFTPLDGLMMATRSGELDPAIVSYLCKQEHKSPEEILTLLNEDSGLKGISGNGSMKELLQSTDPQAQLAVDMFVYHLIKAIGAFYFVLKGADALLFSGGIGENSPILREKVLRALPFKIEHLVIPTDENYQMCSDIHDFLCGFSS